MRSKCDETLFGKCSEEIHKNFEKDQIANKLHFPCKRSDKNKNRCTNQDSKSGEEIAVRNNSKLTKSPCKMCGQKFQFLKALQKHEARHEGCGGFICRTCGVPFTSAEAREKHRDKEHKVLRCKICNIRFDTETAYFHHINSLHEGRDRELSICSECGKQFKTKGELTHHVSSKCGTIKKYECSVCFQTLMTAGSLHNHMLRHTGQRTYMCRFCAKTFLTAGQLTVHERIHTQEKAFVCEICNKGFCHRQSLITHSTLHTGIKPYQCEGCGNAFSCVGNLLKHRKTHGESCGKLPLTTHRVKHPVTKMKVQANTPPTAKLKTLKKQKEFELATNLQDISWQQNINNTNSSCSNSTQNNDLNDVYINSDMNTTIKTQEDCRKTNEIKTDVTPETSMLVKKKNWNPPSTDVKISIEINVNTNIVSDNMPYTNSMSQQNIFVSQADFKQSNLQSCAKSETERKPEETHLFSYTQKEDNISENDDNCTNENIDTYSEHGSESSEDSLDLYTRQLQLINKNKRKIANEKIHKMKIHPDKIKEFVEERRSDRDKRLSCKYCGNLYSVPLWLMKHEQKHEEAQRCDTNRCAFKCSCCNNTFATKDECANHQQCAHADQLSCTECDRIFANPDSIKAHINFYHKGVPRKKYIYVCDKCGKVFKQKALLLSHEQSNCGEGPHYQCDICKKAFTSKHVQKSHMRIHLPEKSLLCKFCGKSFHWKGQLKIHERSHTGERPFKCQFCPKAFSYRESLITHSTLHSGLRPHLCAACGSRFSCIGNLLKHRRTHADTCAIATTLKAEM